jgi:TRAP-type C4-dicarboxylate transport system permease large subunit
MIVYGVTAEVSIAQLFIAGVLPGLLLMAMFMGYTAIWALLNPAQDAASGTRRAFHGEGLPLAASHSRWPC